MPNYLRKRVKSTTEKETVLIGAHVPINIANYVALFCEADGCSKTSILSPLIRKWAKKARKKFSEEELIKLTAKRGWDAWKNRPSKRTVFPTFISGLERELKKRLPLEIVKEIIILVKNEKNKENEEKNS